MRPALALALAAAALLGGCRSPDGVEADRARIEVGERVATVAIDACGLDEDRGVVFLTASGAGLAIQVLLVLDDERRVDLAASAATVTVDQRRTLGAGDPALYGTLSPQRGELTDGRVDGARIQVAAETVVVEAGSTAPGTPAEPLEIDATCPDDPVVALAARPR